MIDPKRIIEIAKESDRKIEAIYERYKALYDAAANEGVFDQEQWEVLTAETTIENYKILSAIRIDLLNLGLLVQTMLKQQQFPSNQFSGIPFPNSDQNIDSRLNDIQKTVDDIKRKIA